MATKKTKQSKRPSKSVITDEVRNDQMSTSQPEPAPPDSARERDIVNSLESYRLEAKNAREGGPNNRDEKWRENLDLYWNRYDFSKKATWQAKETMPEVPAYVDRFASALKEALVANPAGFYTVTDPADKDNEIGPAIKRANDVWLTRSGRNQMGQLLPFTTTFEEQMKLGAIMAVSTVTNWKEDVEFGRVAIETVDPRKVWLDPTYRNLYRVREIEMDRHDLLKLAQEKDSAGTPIHNLPEVSRLTASVSEALLRSDQERASGHGAEITSSRSPIILHEYIATVVDNMGEVIADKSLMVVANNQFLIRGPEKNPFWHNNDWLTYAPLVTVPLSVYGRSYMEDFGSVAKTFTELTNMLLDAVHTSSMKAFAVVPDMLLNPGQLAEGMSPNKMFQLEGGFRASDFAQALDLGTLPPDAFKLWDAMKNELVEAAKVNEIGMGQFAPKGRTSATEVNSTQQNSSALIRSVAETVELRWLDPQLDLAWKTGLQHVHPDDDMIRSAMGSPMFDALIADKKNRKELASRPITFQARGISTLLKKAAMIQVVMQIMQIVASNPQLLQAFMMKVDAQKFVDRLFEWSNIDLTSLQPSERELKVRAATQQTMQAQQQAEQPGQGTPEGPGADQMGQLAGAMGVAK